MSRIIFSLLLGIASCVSYAETVYVPIGEQASEKQSIPRPQQGMTKNQVEEQFGKPSNWQDPVGEPPISRWIYDGYTVYFEYEYVIHSVLAHTPSNN